MRCFSAAAAVVRICWDRPGSSTRRGDGDRPYENTEGEDRVPFVDLAVLAGREVAQDGQAFLPSCLGARIRGAGLLVAAL